MKRLLLNCVTLEGFYLKRAVMLVRSTRLAAVFC